MQGAEAEVAHNIEGAISNSAAITSFSQLTYEAAWVESRIKFVVRSVASAIAGSGRMQEQEHRQRDAFSLLNRDTSLVPL